MSKLLIIMALGLGSVIAPAAEAPRDLRCEYLENPEGIDANPPRFSWRLPGVQRRGAAQSAYQIVAASSLNALKGSGDRWDSGRVESSRQHLVPYEGGALASGDTVYWKVRYWDEQGRLSHWSEPAHFSMGLLDPSDWRGQWIGYPYEDRLPIRKRRR